MSYEIDIDEWAKMAPEGEEWRADPDTVWECPCCYWIFDGALAERWWPSDENGLPVPECPACGNYREDCYVDA